MLVLIQPSIELLGNFSGSLRAGVRMFFHHPEIEINECRIEVCRRFLKFFKRVGCRLIPMCLDPFNDTSTSERCSANNEVVERATECIDI